MLDACYRQVLRGKPEEELPKFWKRWNVSQLHFEKDTEAYARKRDASIVKIAEEAGEICLLPDQHSYWLDQSNDNVFVLQACRYLGMSAILFMIQMSSLN